MSGWGEFYWVTSVEKARFFWGWERGGGGLVKWGASDLLNNLCEVTSDAKAIEGQYREQSINTSSVNQSWRKAQGAEGAEEHKDAYSQLLHNLRKANSLK